MQPIATIEVHIAPNGDVRVGVSGAAPTSLLVGALETAKHAIFQKTSAPPQAVQPAPIGLTRHLLKT
jgi:hypothetical protein